LHLTKSGAFGAIVLLTISLLALGDFLKATHLPSGTSAKDIILFLMGLLPLLLGIWELYENKMASRELLWQYRTQLSRFSLAQLQLAHTATWSQRRDILVALSKDSLMESYLWSIHRYHREHEAPSAA
jgi:hypothetical protein